MDKQKTFWTLITIIVAIVFLFVVINVVFKSDSVNEGKFRVTDAILTSTAELANKSDINGTWSINVSQRNMLSLLISAASESEIAKVYLSDISVSGNNSVVVSQLDKEVKSVLNNGEDSLELDYSLTEEKQMLLELVFLNENILKNWNVPESIKEIVYDGRIFRTAGMKLNDVQIKLQFKLNIVEKIGKTNVLKVKMILPNEELLTTGADVRKLPLIDFKFRVK